MSIEKKPSKISINFADSGRNPENQFINSRDNLYDNPHDSIFDRVMHRFFSTLSIFNKRYDLLFLIRIFVSILIVGAAFVDPDLRNVLIYLVKEYLRNIGK